MTKCIHNEGTTCGILKVKECKDCNMVETSAAAYLDQLVGMYRYICKRSANNIYALRVEIFEFCDTHGLNYPELPDPHNPYADLNEVYNSEVHRGEKGGSNEGIPNNNKAIMNDNRVLDTKGTKTQRNEIKAATEEWEAKHGKLDKLGRSPLSRNRTDSYTGEAIK